MHFYTWRRGLKTGMYYLRTRVGSDAAPSNDAQEALGGDDLANEFN